MRPEEKKKALVGIVDATTAVAKGAPMSEQGAAAIVGALTAATVHLEDISDQLRAMRNLMAQDAHDRQKEKKETIKEAGPGHPDGDYSYLCGSDHCRCTQ